MHQIRRTPIHALVRDEMKPGPLALAPEPGHRIIAIGHAGVLRVVQDRERRDAQGGGMAVFVVDGGRARLVPVTLGARNGSQAWVKDGLQPGAQVIVYPPAAVKEGAPVKVRSV